MQTKRVIVHVRALGRMELHHNLFIREEQRFDMAHFFPCWRPRFERHAHMVPCHAVAALNNKSPMLPIVNEKSIAAVGRTLDAARFNTLW